MKKFAILSVLLLVAGMASAQSDDCATALPIGDGTVSGDTTGFSGIDESSCSTGGGGDTVDGWYEYTATCTGFATASTCDQAGFDTTLSAFDSCGGTELGCNDDGAGCGAFSSLMTFPVTAGNTYLVRIAGYDGAEGTFDLTMSCAVPPPGDDCDTAELVGALPFVTAIDNSAYNPGLPSSSCNSGAPTTQNDVWYTWTVENTCDFTVTVDHDAGAGYDGVVGLYTGTCGSLTEAACNDEPEPAVIDVFGAAAGITYYLQVGDWGTGAGGGLTDIDIVEVVPGSCGVVPVELMSFGIE